MISSSQNVTHTYLYTTKAENIQSREQTTEKQKAEKQKNKQTNPWSECRAGRHYRQSRKTLVFDQQNVVQDADLFPELGLERKSTHKWQIKGCNLTLFKRKAGKNRKSKEWTAEKWDYLKKKHKTWSNKKPFRRMQPQATCLGSASFCPRFFRQTKAAHKGSPESVTFLSVTRTFATVKFSFIITMQWLRIHYYIYRS